MATSITDRLTAAIRLAEQSIEMAQYQADHRNWKEVLRVMQDARDELGKPRLPDISDPKIRADLANIIVSVSSPSQPVKLDGRTKEARAAKAAQ